MAESELKISLQNILNERQKKSVSKHNEAERLSQIRKESLEKLDRIHEKFISLSQEDRAIICGGESYACLESIPEKRTRLCMSFDQAIRELTALETRFKRSTVNLVVIGAMGAGKSKFLQSASGLTDECIPSYSKRSCTGVTSIIENSDAETEALFTFKTLREVTEELDREIRYFAARLHAEDKMIPVSSISDGVRNLNTLKDVLNQGNQRIVDITSGIEREVTDADRKDIEDLLAIYEKNKSVWMPYLADSKTGGLDPDLSVQETDGIRKCVLRKKSKIEEYVSKHNKDGTRKYYKYVAIKKAVIRTKFPGSIDAHIQLIDTVGIGDPAVDTEKRMLEAIQDEADGVIFILEGTDRYENHVMPKDQTLIGKFQEIYTSYRNRAGGEQKETRYWMAFLVNNWHKDGADDDYGQGYLDSAIIPSFNGRGKVFGEGGIALKKAINVGNSREVGEMLSGFLKQISNHLKEIDAGLEKDAEKAVSDAIAQHRKVMDRLGGVRINSISNSLRNSMNLLREERMNALIQELCKYADETVHREADDNTSASYLHQSLEKIRILMNGEDLPEFAFGPKKDVVSLKKLIDSSSAGYPKDPDSARIAVLQTLQSVIREIGSRPLENQKDSESAFKEKIADLFAGILHLDCLKLGDGVLEALHTNDPHFFSKISQKLLTGLNNTEDIQKAFQSLDQFRLDSSNGITKALFNYFSAKYLTDTLYEEANIYREKGATKKDLLQQELEEKLQQFIDAVNERTNNEAYMVAENEQMYGELVNFINVLGRKYEAAWKDVFDSMVERKLLLDVTEKRERLENVAAIAEEIEAQLKNI